MTAATIVHHLAGSPAVDGCAPRAGRCWICAAEMARGQPVERWQGANFTDQNKVRHPEGTHVCEPCVWCMSWVQPPGMPPAAPGKKGLNLRLFSHLHDERGYIALNKADKPAIRAWLREPKQGKWFAAIADTGQKHVLPWTPVNPPGARGLVRFEEHTISLPRDWSLIDSMTRMLTGGVTKDEIARGEYSVRTWREFEPSTVRAFEGLHGRMRGSAWFGLALWLSQRDEETYESRRGKTRSAPKPSIGGGARDASPVSRGRGESVEALGADPQPDAHGGANVRKRGGVGDSTAAVAHDRDAEQQSFDFDT